MSTLVMKFGGASVEKPELFSSCAEIILERSKKYRNIAVVVSAMKGMTDELIALAKKVNYSPQPREYDMLISVGERISISLLAMALAKKECEAVSFTGSQTGIITCHSHTNAKIIDVNPYRLFPHLELGKVVIVAGFQGVSRKGDVTTLGRGGSDTTAVALGVALKAEKVEFYKDVPGIFEKDPKNYPGSSLLTSLTYQQALQLARKGAQVLHERSIFLASQNQMPLIVLSFKDFLKQKELQGTFIGKKGRARPNPSYENAYKSRL